MSHADILGLWTHSGLDESSWSDLLVRLSLDLLIGLLLDLEGPVVEQVCGIK
jgi:hypothetical protein